jgi:hypothetical protein
MHTIGHVEQVNVRLLLKLRGIIHAEEWEPVLKEAKVFRGVKGKGKVVSVLN